MGSGKAKLTQIGMGAGRVSRKNVEVSSQFEEEQMLRGELNTPYYTIVCFHRSDSANAPEAWQSDRNVCSF
jgi:hypothetical protein